MPVDSNWIITELKLMFNLFDWNSMPWFLYDLTHRFILYMFIGIKDEPIFIFDQNKKWTLL